MTQLSQEPTPAAAGHPQGGWLPPPLDPPARSRRLLAAVALLALLAGVPVALALSVGSPLPGALPALGDAEAVLSGPLSPSLIVDALALVAWAAWAHFAVCAAVELSAAVRASRTERVQSAPRVPLGGVSQQLARRLVEAALVTATVAASVGTTAGSGTILTPARPAAAAQELPAAVPVAFARQHGPGSDAAATAPATLAAGEQQAARPRPQYVVEPPHGGYYDSLWDIAERVLGDGMRWREIYELNKSLEQPDGRALTRPDLIRPGWKLYLPADATGLPANQVAGERSATPAPHQGTTPALAAPVRPEVPHAQDPGADLGDDEQATSGPVPAIGALLAAAVLGQVALLRHRQRRRRPAGRSIPLPEPSVAATEGQLRVLAEPDDLSFVDEALRALTVSLQEHDMPNVRSATLRAGRLDLRLAQAAPDAPPPFVAADAGLTWSVSTDERPLVSPTTSDQVLPLLPLLLTVSREADGPVLLDLEAAGSLALDGLADDVIAVLAHLVAETVLAPWADAVEVLLVGMKPGVASGLELLAPDRVTAVAELDPSLLRVLEMRSSRVAAAGDRLRARILGSGTVARDEVRPPLLVVHAAPLPAALAEQLATLVPEEGRGGVVIVAPAPWPEARATWSLGDALPLHDAPAPIPCRLEEDRLHALAAMLQKARERTSSEATSDSGDGATADPQPASTAAETQPADQPALRALGATLAAADSEVPVGPDGDDVDEPGGQLDEDVAAYLEGTAPVTVGLLGPITVNAKGSVEPDRRARLTEIVAYLATHRTGAPLCDFDTAIWPDRPVTLKTRNQAITRTRAWLGVDKEGVSWLRPLSDGSLRLSSRVLVDWELVQALQKRARERGRSRAGVRRDLETALRLVRGRPLSQLPVRRYGWLAETYLEQEIPSAVIDVAHALAQILLQDGDADGVVRVARLALSVDSYDERPWRDLLQAHELRGEHRQITVLVDQLHELLDVELDDELQPETAELIERLLPRRHQA